MSPKKTTPTTATDATGSWAEERAAMQERAKEMKAEARTKKNRADGEKVVLELKIVTGDAK